MEQTCTKMAVMQITKQVFLTIKTSKYFLQKRICIPYNIRYL